MHWLCRVYAVVKSSLLSVVAFQTALRYILCCVSACHHRQSTNVFAWLVSCDRCKHHAVILLSVSSQASSLSKQHSMILSPVALRTIHLLWHVS